MQGEHQRKAQSPEDEPAGRGLPGTPTTVAQRLAFAGAALDFLAFLLLMLLTRGPFSIQTAEEIFGDLGAEP